MNKKLILRSLAHAVIVIAYIFGVAFFMSNGERVFGGVSKVFGSVAFLLMFVVSAAFMGILIFGKPIFLYLDNQKKDAVKFLFYTVGWLLAALILTFCFLTIF